MHSQSSLGLLPKQSGVSPYGVLSLFVTIKVWVILRIVIGVLPTPHPTTVTEEIDSSVIRDSLGR